MRIAVFGATGLTGKEILNQALELGFEVIAYIRNLSKLNLNHDNLTIIVGELNNQELIEKVVREVDAVICVLGPRARSKNQPLSKGIQNIIAAMKKYSVKRLIISSTLSASDPNDLPEFRAKMLVFLVKILMKSAYEEIINIVEEVRASGLDWTIIRLTLLNNKPKSGKIKVGYLGRKEVGTWISRSDIASFMLQQLQNTKYLRQAPVISN